MNSLERIVHHIVGDYPWLKDPLVYTYHRFLALVPTKDHVAYRDIKVRAGFFFGFHDNSPWSSDGKFILSHKFPTAAPPKEPGSCAIEFGLFEDDSLDSFRAIGKTTAWNWQQGSSLQWVRSRAGLFAVNTLENGLPRTEFWDVSGKRLCAFSLHLANVSPNGRHGVSYCFRRLSIGMSGYGYGSVSRREEADRISVIDLFSGKAVATLGLRDLTALNPTNEMGGAFHFFSHALFSPDSTRFLFFHRWRRRNGVLHTRLYSVDINGENLFSYPSGDYSHLAWRNNSEILAYCRADNQKWGYYLLKDRSGAAVTVGQHFFTSDGHPQFRDDGNSFITDSYPDRYRQQRLFTYSIDCDDGKEIASFKIPHEFRRAYRCDFHPRWSPDGETICFDSTHTGVRSLCILRL
jgi:hypothetical protein